MKNIHMTNSFWVWNPRDMKYIIAVKSYLELGTLDAQEVLNRSYNSMCIEWWLHNIGYYLTKPLCRFSYFKNLNQRFKDIDLEEWA